MGLFDKMFGGSASDSEQQQGAQQRFNELKQKYQSVLNMADQQAAVLHAVRAAN